MTTFLKYEIIEILKKYNECENKKFNRFNSWKYCYEFFRIESKKKFINTDKEKASLHLATYLASWGMYRGSTFLLQNDYSIHNSVIEIVIKYNYTRLENFEEIKSVSEEIVSHYENNALPNLRNNTIVTETLLTKILLGIYGCVPAYDRFLIKGFESCYREGSNITKISKKFNKDSYGQLIKFYETNKAEFDKFNNDSNYVYPIMKLIDMYFWQVGFEEYKFEKLLKINH